VCVCIVCYSARVCVCCVCACVCVCACICTFQTTPQTKNTFHNCGLLLQIAEQANVIRQVVLQPQHSLQFLRAGRIVSVQDGQVCETRSSSLFMLSDDGGGIVSVQDGQVHETRSSIYFLLSDHGAYRSCPRLTGA